jgi:hypothetical protein
MGFFQKIFGRERDTDQLIFDLAEQGNRPSDLSELYRRLPRLELFCNVIASNFPLQNGARVQIGPGQILQIESATLPSHGAFVRLFVTRDDARLRAPYVGIDALEACKMVFRMENVNGLVILNSKNSWVALPKSELNNFLAARVNETTRSIS